MREFDFALDGIWASDMGITLCRPVSFSAAVPRIQTIQIPGRNGALHIDEGAYNTRTGTVDCYALEASNVTGKMASIMSFLMGSGGYKELRVSDDPDHYWQAIVSNAGQIAARLGMLNPFSIEFECKPFRIFNDSETFIDVDELTELKNPSGFNAYPLLFVTASGEGTISNRTGTIDILESGSYFIDCEDQRAYKGGGEGVDSYISSEAFPYLPTGYSGFTVTSGITLKVAPRWRTL